MIAQLRVKRIFMINMKKFETSDIGIAAYVMMKGLRLSDASRGSGGRLARESPRTAGR